MKMLSRVIELFQTLFLTVFCVSCASIHTPEFGSLEMVSYNSNLILGAMLFGSIVAIREIFVCSPTELGLALFLSRALVLLVFIATHPYAPWFMKMEAPFLFLMVSAHAIALSTGLIFKK